MLNLYVVPKANKPVQIDGTQQQEIIDLLTDMGILGYESSPGEYGPGLGVSKLFHSDYASLLSRRTHVRKFSNRDSSKKLFLTSRSSTRGF